MPNMVTAQRDSTRLDDRVQERVALRSRPGRRFAPTVEQQLAPVLRDLASRLPGAAAGVTVIAEMAGPTGLPDLVAVPVSPRLAARLALPCPPLLTWSDARLAAACSTTRAWSVSTLARRLDADDVALRRRLRRLVVQGALEAGSSGYRRVPDLQPVGRLYALEAKVDDWSAGLGQALRYGGWADASAAVLGQLPRDRSKAVTQATDLGLGLALGARWLVRPRVRRLALARRLWASEHVVAALAAETRSRPVRLSNAAPSLPTS
jgi:hypothetical protein